MAVWLVEPPVEAAAVSARLVSWSAAQLALQLALELALQSVEQTLTLVEVLA